MQPAQWQAIDAAGRLPEREAVLARLAEVPFTPKQRQQVLQRARDLVAGCRRRADERSLLDLFLAEFGLSNEEGIALMCISEALLRIPDHDTAEALIAERIGTGDWSAHLGQSDSLFLNASTWALMLTGEVLAVGEDVRQDVYGWLRRLAGRVGESVARAAMSRAVRILADEFVLGANIEAALARADGEPCSFDMLGEGARTAADAAEYAAAYRHAINVVGKATPPGDGHRASGISIKLSALHPRFEPLPRRRVLAELGATLADLAALAASYAMPLTIDAEEAERLELTLELFAQLAQSPALADWPGLGIAVQAYGKRAPAVIDWLAALNRPVMVRLVKGAYWDAEIKRAQVEGLAGYPVYTRKAATDAAYLACAARLFQAPQLYPQFASHNAHTLAAVLALGDEAGKPYEFQRLHGMGALLYDEAKRRRPTLPLVRVYAPVGPHKDLLAYLVRRLLENGANSSFVNRFLNDKVPLADAVEDPVATVQAVDATPHPHIRLPPDLFAPERANSAGLDVGNREDVQALVRAARSADVPPQPVPTSAEATAALVAKAAAAFPAWEARPATERREVLRRVADLLEANCARFVAVLAAEAGKTLRDAVAEVREAADFSRYYGAECERLFATPTALPGPTGETNALHLHGRGVFACLSPWNFPLAIFTGQVAASLAAGNTVVAKPAPQTPATAALALALMHEAGVPEDAACLAVGGTEVGAALVAAPRIAGVAFTGSTATAKRIAAALAAKPGPIVPFIAETGGQNAMIVDSSALPEQVTDDVMASAFRSAGQRCSALRVLYVQEEVAPRVLDLIVGAMQTLTIGNPAEPSTDVGPVIDAPALARLETHIERCRERVVYQCPLPKGLTGTFLGPTLIEVDSIAALDAEHFGPILHIARFRAADLGNVLQDISAAGYGLTLGIHSRIDRRAEEVMAAVKAGNTYVNRDMIGAVVGVQPFGGEGLSGTGPKAGGPHYLPRFAVERCVTWNTAAKGGNAELLSLAAR